MANLEEGGRAVGDDAITLHLSEAQAAVPGTALHRLPRQYLHRAAAPGVDLVIDLHAEQASCCGPSNVYCSPGTRDTYETA